MRRPRIVIAGAILLLWGGGLLALSRRESAGGQASTLARAALFVSPGAEYYEVRNGGRHVGFASSTIDTTTTRISITDVVVADVDSGATPKRLAARGVASLTRGLHLVRFVYEMGADASPYRTTGTISGDTLLTLVIRSGAQRPDTQHVRLSGPLLLPTMVPMVMTLAERPTVGRSYTYDVFDPLTNVSAPVTLTVRAESTFAVPDSAAYDAASRVFVPVHTDTVHAWHIDQAGGGPLSGWIDNRGRMVDAEPLPHLQLVRSAYELAYLNWARAQPTPLPPHAIASTRHTP